MRVRVGRGQGGRGQGGGRAKHSLDGKDAREDTIEILPQLGVELHLEWEGINLLLLRGRACVDSETSG